ncbi:MAG: nucleotidyltransferase [Bacteroidetes bacterium]|nr:MAG: nucleotidyltransferase [Bacteroidota bacterium]
MSDTGYLHFKIDDFEKALNKFAEVAYKPNKTELERDATIQRFEFTYEIAWKCLKKALESRGADKIAFTRDVFKSSLIGDYIDDEALWSEIISNRNLSVHTYNEAFIVILESKLALYCDTMKLLLQNLKKYH